LPTCKGKYCKVLSALGLVLLFLQEKKAAENNTTMSTTGRHFLFIKIEIEVV